ncbi:MAG TPA: hypothetical protein PLG43_10105 [Spirochaetia bacterium]|nr:hypothetical protein [Spirochaetia bacterium]
MGAGRSLNDSMIILKERQNILKNLRKSFPPARGEGFAVLGTTWGKPGRRTSVVLISR